MKIAFQEEDTHLVAVCEGESEPAAVTVLLEAIRNRAAQTSQTRILCDWFGVSAPEDEFYRYLAGEDAARILPHPFRTAVTCRKELINRFAENTATNRFAVVRVFGTEKEALGWLLETDAP